MHGTREEPGTLTQGGALFPLVFLYVVVVVVVVDCCVCVYYCSTYYKAVREGGGGEWRTCATRDYEPRPM